MEPKKLASQIIKEVGGKENIKEMFHCVTRFRFYLKDRSVVDLDRIKKLDGVIGAQYQTDQLQIIIGNEVEDVYNAAVEQIGFVHNEETIELKKKFKAKGLFETMAAIFLPTIPALAGAGMIKGLITILTSYCGVDPASEFISVLTIAGDCVFYFFPFLVAWAAAKRFKTDVALSLGLAGALLYPTMTAGQLAGADPMHFLGLPIPFVRYYGSSIPIILTVFVLSLVYPFVNKFIHKSLRLVFTPLIVLLIMVPLTLVAIAPAANYLAQTLVYIVKFLYDLSPLIAGMIVGATRLLVVLTGMHLSLGAICMENLATFGYDYLLPMNTMGTLALFGVCMGVWVKSRNTETKSIGASTAISSFIGITEPGIYGVVLKFRNALISVMIAGGVGGAIVGAFGGHATAYVNSCILSLPVFMGDGFWAVCLGMAVSAALGFILMMVLGISEEKNESSKGEPEKKLDKEVEQKNEIIYTPMSGEIIKLCDVSEEIFSSGQMGKGIAINPTDGVVVAPFDGVVTTVFPTKHAIGLTSNNGAELIIHIGVDTANLHGKYFDVKVEPGQKIKCQDVLVEVDLANILKEGYSLVSPILVTNSDKYLDVLPNEEEGIIVKGEQLLTVLK